MRYTEKLSKYLFAVLLMISSTLSYGSQTARTGTVYFNDNSSVHGPISFGVFGLQQFVVIFNNDRVKLPFAEIKSFEITNVEKGGAVGDGYYEAIIYAAISTKAGVIADVTIRHGYGFSPAVVVRTQNPLTRISEDQTFFWIGNMGTDSGGKGNNVFRNHDDGFRRVIKVVFD